MKKQHEAADLTKHTAHLSEAQTASLSLTTKHSLPHSSILNDKLAFYWTCFPKQIAISSPPESLALLARSALVAFTENRHRTCDLCQE
jgi:hypothetical protein